MTAERICSDISVKPRIGMRLNRHSMSAALPSMTGQRRSSGAMPPRYLLPMRWSKGDWYSLVTAKMTRPDRTSKS
jgi:hypothetical protein